MFGWLRRLLIGSEKEKPQPQKESLPVTPPTSPPEYPRDLPENAQLLPLKKDTLEYLVFIQPSAKNIDEYKIGKLSLAEFWAKHLLRWDGICFPKENPLRVTDNNKKFLMGYPPFLITLTAAIENHGNKNEFQWILDCLWVKPGRGWGNEPPILVVEDGEDYEFISDKTNGIVYHKILTDIMGARFKNKDGSSRYENYAGLQQGQQVCLFWHKSNPKDKNAIAVFPLPGAENKIYDFQQLGFIPREDASDLITLIAQGYTIRAVIDHLHEWFNSNDEFREHSKYDCRLRLNIYIPDNAPFKDQIRYICGLTESSTDNLLAAGYDSKEKINKAQDKELIKIKGVGPKALSNLREWARR